MYCYDENYQVIGVISCIPKEGEEHLFDGIAYVCTGETTDGLGCKQGMIFKKI